MTEYTYSIGKEFENEFPNADSIKHFFEDYEESKWSARGAPSAGFVIYGAENTGDLEPYVKRIDIHLCIYDNPELGVCIYYSKHGGSYGEHIYSLGNKEHLDRHVENRIGEFLSKGLFVSFEDGFKVVKYFIENQGNLHPNINWIKGEDLPEKSFIEP